MARRSERHTAGFGVPAVGPYIPLRNSNFIRRSASAPDNSRRPCNERKGAGV